MTKKEKLEEITIWYQQEAAISFRSMSRVRNTYQFIKDGNYTSFDIDMYYLEYLRHAEAHRLFSQRAQESLTALIDGDRSDRSELAQELASILSRNSESPS